MSSLLLHNSRGKISNYSYHKVENTRAHTKVRLTRVFGDNLCVKIYMYRYIVINRLVFFKNIYETSATKTAHALNPTYSAAAAAVRRQTRKCTGCSRSSGCPSPAP